MIEDVSIYMLAYNHEKFISKAIESIVTQKTQYTFRLYIHDDASTDNTAEIIKKYTALYPDIIIPIYEKNNLYSVGGGLAINRVMYPRFQGKYIALCEGDDYWIDPYKLEMQISYMEMHEQCCYCFTNAIHVDLCGNYKGDFYKYHYWKDSDIIQKMKYDADFNTEEMIRLDFTPTASVLVKKTAYEKYLSFEYPLDLSLRLVATESGYAHFINRKTVAYRVGNANSASGQASQSFSKYYSDFYLYHKKILNEFNQITNYKYNSTIKQTIDRNLVLVYIRFLSKNNYKEFKKLKAYKELTLYRKIRYFLKRYMKSLSKMINSFIARKD